MYSSQCSQHVSLSQSWKHQYKAMVFLRNQFEGAHSLGLYYRKKTHQVSTRWTWLCKEYTKLQKILDMR